MTSSPNWPKQLMSHVGWQGKCSQETAGTSDLTSGKETEVLYSCNVEVSLSLCHCHICAVCCLMYSAVEICLYGTTKVRVHLG